METAIIALVAALLASTIGPWVQKLWVEPKVLLRQKARNAYEVFVENIDGLLKNSQSEEKSNQLCLQYRMIWLYADDSVVNGINNLLRAGECPKSAPEKNSVEWHMGSSILKMRKKNVFYTRLTPCDYLFI